MNRRGLCAAAVFLCAAALFIASLPPSLAAYRDAGEMTLAARTLGICHPPSYPVYVLLGRLAAAFPLGNPAYALNLLSVAAAAGALSLLFYILAGLHGAGPAAAAVVLLGFNVSFRDAAGVQEMYSLTLLFAVALLGLALRLNRQWRLREWQGAMFLAGFFLGNRTDLLLWAPGLLWLAFPSGFRRADLGKKASFLAASAGFALLGLSVYLFLPIRSLQGPWLDWNHPATAVNFLGSLTRSGYGGTLDLLSQSYAAGAMFLPNLKVYAAHFWRNAGGLGLLLTLAGLAAGRRRPSTLFGFSLLYAASGPLFLYLANLPPNPHAMAIVDPHYLLSYLIVAAWAAGGVAYLREAAGLRGVWVERAAVLLALLIPLGLGRLDDRRRRHDFINEDSIGNILRSTPPGAVLVAKKDVQLFGLWYKMKVLGLRPDVTLVAQGLSHSPWYQASERRAAAPVALGQLKSAGGWREFMAANGGRAVFASNDSEFQYADRVGHARGLVVEMSTVTRPSAAPWGFLVRRGDFREEKRGDFFGGDLVGMHAMARQHLATGLLNDGRGGEADLAFKDALWLKRRSPEAASHWAFLAFTAGDMEKSRRRYLWAEALYDETLGLARDYHALPDVHSSISAAAAEALMNLGVVSERQGDRAAAEAAYRKALRLYPAAAKAHYNIAVLYWKKDWDIVVRELEAALRADPNYEPARRYLEGALRMRARP